ncbi:MAG: hypothetical protein GSR85_04665 [Desulfurococcales archaeon]|nr:hypothetical protein [Desulfurococcales archaeon]
MPRIMRRRELSAYMILYDRGPVINLGEAIDIVSKELCSTRRTARNIIKRLSRIKAIYIEKNEASIVIKVRDPVDFMREIAREYIITRKGKCRKGR